MSARSADQARARCRCSSSDMRSRRITRARKTSTQRHMPLRSTFPACPAASASQAAVLMPDRAAAELAATAAASLICRRRHSRCTRHAAVVRRHRSTAACCRDRALRCTRNARVCPSERLRCRQLSSAVFVCLRNGPRDKHFSPCALDPPCSTRPDKVIHVGGKLLETCCPNSITSRGAAEQHGGVDVSGPIPHLPTA